MDGPPEETVDARDDAFGARLRRAREAAGLAQEELAARAGLSPNTVGGLERGEHRRPYPTTVRALSEALGLTDAERAELSATVPTRGRPAPATDTAPSGLPTPLSPLIGREGEVAAVSALLREDGARLVTLTGPGGVGKTSLALHLAAELNPDFAHGAVLVPLAAVRDPARVALSIAQTLGVVETGGRSPVDRLGEALRERHLLLVLDNFEHLLEAAPLVTDLLARCPRLAVLATSRATLRLAGEHVYPVPPLAVPDPDRLPPADELASIAGVRLFVARARAADPAFALTDDNAGAVAAVCHRLDGLPLAIELAAARSALFVPAALLPLLARRLPLLTGGRRDAPARHRTMHDAIAWSHDLLTADEQWLFRRLSVFVGGCTLETVEAVAEGGGEVGGGVLAGLAALVDNSLLRREAGSASDVGDGTPRYLMLETVREYGLDRLAANGGEAVARHAHAAHFLALAERIDPPLSGAPAPAGMDRLDQEHANVQAALAWFERTGDAQRFLRLAASLGYAWEVHGRWIEGADWLERALALDRRPLPARTAALRSLGTILGYLGDFARAEPALHEALRLARELGAANLICDVLVLLGSQLVDQRRYDAAESLLADAVAAARRAGARDLEAAALAQHGVAAWGRGDAAAATARLEAARAFAGTVDGRAPFSVAARYLAHVAIAAGDYPRAATWLRDFASYDPDRARAGMIGRWVPDVASLAAAHGQPERAARLFGAAAALAHATGLVAAWPERELHEQAMATARAALGSDAFAAAVAAGRLLPKEQVLAEVAAVLDVAAGGTPGCPRTTGTPSGDRVGPSVDDPRRG